MMLLSDEAIEARLPRVSAPVLVVMGSADPDFPDAAEEARIIADVTHGTAIVVDGAGHYPHVERPDEVHAAIASFLATLTPGAHGIA